MTLIPPKYRCNKCGIVGEADLDWEWVLPEGWVEEEVDDKHYCSDCVSKRKKPSDKPPEKKACMCSECCASRAFVNRRK